MFRIELAEHVYEIEHQYAYVRGLCRDYLTTKEPECTLSVTAKEILAERGKERTWSEGYLESLAIYRKICERLLQEDILLFHCSALELDGRAYLFTAPSGTGKSTHARLWRERFGERVTVINDDKPLLKITEGEVRVYGTPYGGKEGLQTNTSAPVAGIVLLHQAKENRVSRRSAGEAYPALLNQAYRRKTPEAMIRTMDLVAILSRLPIYDLDCTISQEAVSLICHALTGADPCEEE